MLKNVSTILAQQQARYKSDIYKKVRIQTAFTVYQTVSIYPPPSTMFYAD